MTSEDSRVSLKKAQSVFDFFQELRKLKHQTVKAKTDHDQPTVIIIGAGLAGLASAMELTKNGFYVVLLEARDRIGGRIHSHLLKNGSYVELGAQFLHGIKENPLLKLCDKFKIELKPYSRSSWSAYDKDGHEINKNELKPLIKEYKNTLESHTQQRLSDSKDRFLARDLKEFADTLTSLSVTDPKRLSPLAKLISLHELHEESLFSYKSGLGKKESESNFLVTNGYIKLLDGMLQEAKNNNKLKLELSSEVQKIKHTSDEIIVTCKNGKTFNGDAIICTLPLGVLQHGDVVFVPTLGNDKLRAINNLSSTVHNKVILEFDEAFWDNQSHFLIPSDPDMQAWLDIINLQFFTQMKTPILVASIYTSLHQKKLSDDQMIDHLVKLIQKIHPSSFKPLKKAWVTHWDKDPFSYGSYSYHPEGSSLDDNSEIAKPVGRLIFAGEHTNRSPGNLQGAYLSGLEAAKQTVDQLYFIFKSAGKF